MTVGECVLLGFAILAVIEGTAVMIGAGIPLIKDKIRRRKGKP